MALFVSPVFSAGSRVDLEANPPLTDDDIQLRTWILDLFKTIRPNNGHRMFLELSLQEDSDQYECRSLKQADGSVGVLPELISDPAARIRVLGSWHLRFDKNAGIGIYK